MDSGGKALAVVRTALASISRPGVEYRAHDQGGGLITVQNPAGSATFKLVWAGAGFPRDVRRVMEKPVSHPVMVTANEFSPGAMDMIREEGGAFVDGVGNFEIIAGSMVLMGQAASRLDRRPGPREWTWSHSAAAVAESLLNWRETVGDGDTRLPGIEALASSLPLSRAMLSRVLVAFDTEGWTRKHGAPRGRTATRHLADPAGLLGSWARWEAGRSRPSVSLHALWRDSEAFIREELLPAVQSTPAALTGWSAAAHLAPFSTSIPVIELCVPWDDVEVAANRLVADAHMRRVDAAAARIRLVGLEPTALNATQTVAGLPLARTPRVYADLLRATPRGPEAADHLREQVLGF